MHSSGRHFRHPLTPLLIPLAGMKLQLLVEPRRGWTSKLIHYARMRGSTVDKLLMILFSGPHRLSVSANDYLGKVLWYGSSRGADKWLKYHTSTI